MFANNLSRVKIKPQEQKNTMNSSLKSIRYLRTITGMNIYFTQRTNIRRMQFAPSAKNPFKIDLILLPQKLNKL